MTNRSRVNPSNGESFWIQVRWLRASEATIRIVPDLMAQANSIGKIEAKARNGPQIRHFIYFRRADAHIRSESDRQVIPRNVRGRIDFL